MKLAITLIIIGALLLMDGASRIVMGAISGEYILILGGMLTGVGLGGFLLYKGIRKYARIKAQNPTEDL